MSVNKNEQIDLSQFADDTTVILDGSEHSLSSALETISIFGKHSGLKINIDKTQVVWIGSKKFSNEKLCCNYNLKWGVTSFSMLGLG